MPKPSARAVELLARIRKMQKDLIALCRELNLEEARNTRKPRKKVSRAS